MFFLLCPSFRFLNSTGPSPNDSTVRSLNWRRSSGSTSTGGGGFGRSDFGSCRSTASTGLWTNDIYLKYLTWNLKTLLAILERVLDLMRFVKLFSELQKREIRKTALLYELCQNRLDDAVRNASMRSVHAGYPSLTSMRHFAEG